MPAPLSRGVWHRKWSDAKVMGPTIYRHRDLPGEEFISRLAMLSRLREMQG
jgi:hypothetical protein